MRTYIGARVVYVAFGGEPRVGTVTGAYDDVKNGRPGFDLLTDQGETVWGYDDQLIAVDVEARP